MNDHGNIQFDALPLPLKLEVDRICREFEKAWQAGQSPRIEDFAGRVSGEGHVAADVEIGVPQPRADVGERFWIPKMSLTTHAAWHGMNAHGALNYRLRHARRGFAWQAWPAGDIADEIAPSAPSDMPVATN